MNNIESITKWYSGKALGIITSLVIPALTEAAKLGYWPAGVSRKVRAALNKNNIAAKFAKNNAEFLEALSTGETRHDGARGWDVQHAMYFGHFQSAPALLAEIAKLRADAKLWVEGWEGAYRTHTPTTPDAATLAKLLDTAEQWAKDFSPVAELVDALDATRVPPTILANGLSPTVAANLGKSLGINFTTIRVPEFKTVWVEMEIKGRKVRVPMCEIVWPEGTLHCRSKFSGVSDGGNNCCHACGHAIRNNHNWVPLLAEGADGLLSLWVGSDCAKKLFNVVVKDGAEFTNR